MTRRICRGEKEVRKTTGVRPCRRDEADGLSPLDQLKTDCRKAEAGGNQEAQGSRVAITAVCSRAAMDEMRIQGMSMQSGAAEHCFSESQSTHVKVAPYGCSGLGQHRSLSWFSSNEITNIHFS